MTGSQKQVLIVDDDAETRQMLRSALVRHGMVVDDVEGGEEALELIRERNYAVVLLDLLMPGLDGFAVLDALTAPGMPSPVILVVTGADRSEIDRLDPNRIHGVVRKPFDPDDLGELVLACADIRSRGGLGTMALATMIGGSLLELLNRFGR